MEAISAFGRAYGIYQDLLENPEWERPLNEAVEWEDANPVEYKGHGWQWYDCHCTRYMPAAWVAADIVDVVSQSRAYTHYRLKGREAVREALQMLRVVPEQQPIAKMQIDDLFQYVIGHDDAKYLLTRSLKAESPVHCLLHGPVGTAKSMMLDDIARLSGGHYYAGSNTTKAGLVGFLIEMRPNILCIDEIDKMRNADMTPLLNLMEGGRVTRLHATKRETVMLPTRVFASANEVKGLPAPIYSRFLKIEIPAYTQDEFITVARRVLAEHRDCLLKPELAIMVATQVSQHSLDVRDAVRVGKLVKSFPDWDPKKKVEGVFAVIDAIWGRKQSEASITAFPRG